MACDARPLADHAICVAKKLTPDNIGSDNLLEITGPPGLIHEMTLRLAAFALFAITVAATQNAGVSETITFPTGEPSYNTDGLRLVPGHQLDRERDASPSATCADRNAPECAGSTRDGEHDVDAILLSKTTV
jgi:hypothetical protein